ncbi:(5-formylfuran-3-yl)methyl phosphate synthase [Rivibacter subsaxonicus]|nr:(5-formylfuran-3-yl)methyl phosphate synthase [Rivibacter subsaxonicus]
MQLLVSVRDAAEARLAAAAGVELIDLKEPKAGALGAVALGTIGPIVDELRASHPRARISATVGDLPLGELDAMLAQVRVTAATGVDWVKVGIDLASGSRSEARCAIEALGASGAPVVPVFLADRGIDPTLLEAAARQPFGAWMLDTADKSRGSLLELMADDALVDFIARARGCGALAGLAGSLRPAELPRLTRLAPDVIGFRGAVCGGDRRGALVPERLAALQLAVSRATTNTRLAACAEA